MLEAEDHFEGERKELTGRLEALDSIVRMLELKHKNSLDHASRLEERENELKKVSLVCLSIIQRPAFTAKGLWWIVIDELNMISTILNKFYFEKSFIGIRIYFIVQWLDYIIVYYIMWIYVLSGVRKKPAPL